MKKVEKLLPVIILVMVTALSIGYSAYSSTLNITGVVGEVRAVKDVRITDVTVDSGTVSNLEYGVKNISSTITLPTNSSTVSYNIEIKNIGNTEVAIRQVNGLPSGLDYEFEGYTEKDKICNSNDECKNGITKEITLIISGTAGTYDIDIELDFEQFYNITYTNITGNYPTGVLAGEPLEINFGSNGPGNPIITMGETTLTRGGNCTWTDSDSSETVNKSDVVTCGTESFYVMYTSGNNIVMFAQKGITITTNNPVQSNSAGTAAFASSVYWDSSYLPSSYGSETSPYVYNNQSNLYQYVEAYKQTLQGLGTEVSKARLISYEEMQDLGCQDTSCSSSSTSAPSWIKANYPSYYWIGNATEATSSNVYRISNSGNIRYVSATATSSSQGIRPVIEMPMYNIVDGDYTYTNKVLTIPNVDGDINIEQKVYTLRSGTTFNSRIKTLVKNDGSTVAYSKQDSVVKTIGFYSNGDLPEGITLQQLQVMDSVDVTSSTDVAESVMAYYDGNGNVYVYSEGKIKAGDCKYMFNYFYEAEKIELSQLDTSGTTNMTSMFQNCNALKTIDFTNFDVSNVQNMGSMFSMCTKLTEVDFSNFTNTALTNVGGMFYNCQKLKKVDFSRFTFENVTNITQIFTLGYALGNIDLRSADLSAVTSYDSNAFYGVPKGATIYLKDTQANRTFMSTNFSNYNPTYISS